MTVRLVLWGAVVVAASALAFVLLDPVIAAFVVIVLLTALGVGIAARDWDRHSTFEERELERARARAEKWERNKDVRERDRVRWEAHQTRQSRKAVPRD